MQIIPTVILYALLTGSALAQQVQYRDSLGQPVGTSYSSGSVTQYRDANGAPSGSSYSYGGVTQSYSANGAPSGSANSGDSNINPVLVPASVYLPIGSPVGTGSR